MKYKKFKAAFFISLIFIAQTILFSCNGVNTDNNKNQPENTGESAAENIEETTESRLTIPDGLPEMDFGGYKFIFYTSISEMSPKSFTPESETGAGGSDAVFRRNRIVEERFNVEIKTVESGGDIVKHTDMIKKAELAGDVPFDVAFVHCVYGPNITLENLAYNLLEVPYLDFNKPWWQKQTDDEMTLAGKMFLGSNSMFYNGLATTYVLFFNKAKIADYGLEMPYQNAVDGTWTLDKLISMTKDVYVDLDGNGQKDTNDFYGFVSQSVHSGFQTSCDISILEKNDEDILKLSVNNEKTIEFVDKMYDWYYNTQGTYAYADYTSPYEKNMFSNNQAMFVCDWLGTAQLFASSEIDYGIVPMPKYDEKQKNYMSFSSDTFFMVPQTISGNTEALERIGIILEAMSAEGYKRIIPAYYEIALKNKYMQDEESTEVLDLVNDSRTVTFAYSYDNWQGFAHMFVELFGAKPTRDFTSFYEKREKVAQSRIDKIVNAFTEY